MSKATAEEMLNEQAAEVGATDWLEPAPLGDELPPVPVFDLELLPASLRPLVADISERMQTPPDYAAAAGTVSLGACVNRRMVITPKREDTSWRVFPNLWGAIVGAPGLMKSPVVHAITSPLAHIEQQLRIEYESAAEEFEIEEEKADLRKQAWKQKFTQAAKKGAKEPYRPDYSLVRPVQKRLILTDSTPEKLHEILADNPAGVLVLRDELSGWLADLERQGRESERGFYLQAWNGDGGFAMDRIGRGSIYVPAVCVSLFGNIQPARLRWYLSDAIRGGPGDDGLFQRFQIFVWPDPPHNWKLVDRPANARALKIIEDVFSKLAGLSAENPVRAFFAPDAQELFFEWWSELEAKVRGDGLHPALIAHVAKYRSLMPSLAGLFELADQIAGATGVESRISIWLEHTKQAAALCDYLEQHARRVYSCMISPETRAARELARHIKAVDLSSPFPTRAVYLKGWSGLDTPDRVRGALEVLEDAGWVRRAAHSVLPAGGRPPELWDVNPKVARRA